MPTFALLITGFVSFLLIVIVLLQRGRGGGLAGALGGMGGQSAFGTRAGDVFTRITVILAIIWTVMAGVTGMAMQRRNNSLFPGGANAPTEMRSTGDDEPEQTAPPVTSTPEGSTSIMVPELPSVNQPATAPLTGEAVPPVKPETPAAAPATTEKPAEAAPADTKPTEEAKPETPAEKPAE